MCRTAAQVLLSTIGARIVRQWSKAESCTAVRQIHAFQFEDRGCSYYISKFRPPGSTSGGYRVGPKAFGSKALDLLVVVSGYRGSRSSRAVTTASYHVHNGDLSFFEQQIQGLGSRAVGAMPWIRRLAIRSPHYVIRTSL